MLEVLPMVCETRSLEVNLKRTLPLEFWTKKPALVRVFDAVSTVSITVPFAGPNDLLLPVKSSVIVGLVVPDVRTDLILLL